MNGFYLTGVSLHNSVLSHFILTAAWQGKESRSPISTLQMRTLFLEELSQGPTPDTELRSKWGLGIESPSLGALSLSCHSRERVQAVCSGRLAATELVGSRVFRGINFGHFPWNSLSHLRDFPSYTILEGLKEKSNVLQVLIPAACTCSAGPGLCLNPGSATQKGNEP